MKTSLQLRIGQQLAMTPQLQQAIRLLQLSTMELQTEIQQVLESNPMLEVEESSDDDGLTDGAEPKAEVDGAEVEFNGSDDLSDGDEASAAVSDAETQNIPDDLPVDSQWEDVYDGASYLSGGASDDDGQDLLDTRNSPSVSLTDHLIEQLNLITLSETDQAIAFALIDALEDDGYLRTPLEEIHESLAAELEIDFDETEAVLRQIQQLDPAGIAARDLRECLTLQLEQLEGLGRTRALAKAMVAGHLDTVAMNDVQELMRVLEADETEVREALATIRNLHPRPGTLVANDDTQYIAPDVFVRRDKDRWRVELNPDIAPRLRINSLYASVIRRADTSEANTFLRTNLQEARWFIKSLQSRNETLLRVATAIVERQRAFLEYGEEAMKPLVLRDIAETLEMHESTVSRVTTQKYMYTPRGIFEFKYFFSSHVGTVEGGACSSTAIRAMIRKLVAAENPAKPLSDSKIASLLGERGIQVARRTVAKYRETLAIPPSKERRRLA